MACEELRQIGYSGNSGRSEEIECQVGHYLEVIHRERLLSQRSFHPDASSGDIQFSPDHISAIRRRKSTDDHDIETKDISMIMRSELLRTQGTSWQAAVIIMVNCTIGMGLLNFPHAILKAGGILPALATQTVTLLFLIVSLTMLCYLSQYYGDVSYQGIIGSHLGRIPKIICRVFIFINNFSTLVVFLVVMGDQLDHIIKAIQGEDRLISWYTKRIFIVPVVSTCIIFPFCLCKRFDNFKYTSFLGVIASIYVAFGLIMTRYFVPGSAPKYVVMDTSPSNLLQIIPVICFAYECHIEIPPMVACLKIHGFWYYQKMIFGYTLLSCIVYSVSGIFGYLSFGQHTPDDIVLAYAPNDVLVIVALVLLSLKIITTYPVVFYCLRIVIEDVVRSHWRIRQSLGDHDFKIRVLVSIVLFVCSVFIAIFVPSITSVISLIGGVSAVFIFLFPGMCYLRLYSQKDKHWDWKLVLLGAFYVVMGTFLLTFATAEALQAYIRH